LKCAFYGQLVIIPAMSLHLNVVQILLECKFGERKPGLQLINVFNFTPPLRNYGPLMGKISKFAVTFDNL
jgi:hypothetical protein